MRSDPMRILWLGHNLAYPPKGGVLQRNFNLLREASKSCEVHVLAFDQPATRPPGVSPEDCVHGLKNFCKTVEWVPLPGGHKKADHYWLACRQLVSKDPFVIHWLHSKEMMAKIKHIIDRTSFDIVHIDTLGLAQYRPLVQDSATVLNHHNLESSMVGRRVKNTRNIFSRAYFGRDAQRLRKAEQEWCTQFRVNLVVSTEEEELLKSWVPGVETAVVANGVDIEYFTPRPDPGGRTLLFCGGLSWYPNRGAMEFFFDKIWPRLTAWSTDVQMYVVGRRPPGWLQRLGERDDRIRVTGFVDDVRPYFEKATAYVCPIKDGGGTRLKILDALAMGIPVIGTSFACSGLGLKGGKHVLLADTPEDFAHRIKQILTDEPLRRSLAEAGREIVEQQYSWTVIGKSLSNTYLNASRPRTIRMNQLRV